MIVVVDCGMGNLQSVVRALKKAGGQAIASSAVAEVETADKIVLPGVGSFAHGLEHLRRHQLLPVLMRKVCDEKTPALGICLGHQLLTAASEEGGGLAGLGWIDGTAKRLRFESDQQQLKIPHMGWNTLDVLKDCPLLRGIPAEACFYFAHSYCVHCGDRDTIVATTHYGCDFVSVVHKENVLGTQFHPEKSHANGITVLKNFVEYT